MTGRSVPVVADRPTAAAALATVAAVAALVGSDLATRAAPGDQVRDEGTGNLVAGAIAVAVGASAASLLGPRRTTLDRRAWGFRTGLACAWAGVGMNRWARRTLGRGYRPVVTVLAGQEVVASGPYRVVRHPMYVGSILLSVGAGTALGPVPASLVWLLPPLALLRRIAVEERVLAEALGDRYRAYASGRARLVPGLW